MALLSAMQSAAIRLVGQRPSVFFGSSEQFQIEICDLVNEVAADVVASNDWQGLTRLHTIAGDGIETEFNLPDDYLRQLVRSDVQDSNSWAWGYLHITDVNDFTYDQNRGWPGFPGAWIILQNKMMFTPAPTGNATFPYISKNYAVDTATLSPKDSFTADTDEFVPPERLLTLGLVWRWREQKKLDYSGDQEAFAKALSEYASRDRGSRIIRSRSRLPLRGTQVGWPWALG